MTQPITLENFRRIHLLHSHFNEFVPVEERRSHEFRSELAGLLTVSIAATYENCVKESMISYASSHGMPFEGFVERTFEKLNSKITANDLRNYASRLDPTLGVRFKETLARRKRLISRITGKSIETQLEQLLKWRHAYAHSGKKLTTIEEAIQTHRLACIPIRTFEEVVSAE
jgi:hypothetical protein